MSRTNKLFVFAIAVLSMVMSAVAALSFANINFGNGAKNQSNQVVENHQNQSQDDSNDYVDAKHVVKYDYLPLEVENGVLMAYTGEDNAVLKVPSSYSVREDGKLVEGDDYRITKIGENAFKGVKFAYCEVDMTNINEVGASAFENAKNVHIVNGQNGYHIGDYAFKNAKVVLDQIVLLADKGNKKAVGTEAFTGTQKFDISLAKTLANAGIVWAAEGIKTGTIISTNETRGILTIGQTSFSSNNLDVTELNLENFKGIVNIGDSAFAGTLSSMNTNLTTVKLGAGMYSFGSNAFYCCRNIGNENVSSNVFTMKGSLSSLGEYSFMYSGIKHFDLSKASITVLPAHAFDTCISLTGELKIPNSVTTIGDSCFNSCAFTGNLVIPESVTSIGDSAFKAGGTSLNGTLKLSANVTSIGSYAFCGHSNLAGEIELPNIQQIGTYAFERCNKLTSIYLGDNISEIPDYAFWACTGLKSITLPENIESIGIGTFKNCSSLTSITIPDSVTSIGSGCFDGCTSLTGIKSGNNAESGYIVCQTNTNIESFALPTHSEFTTIGANTFKNWTALKSVYIPSNVCSIGDDAFLNTNTVGVKNGSAVDTTNKYIVCATNTGITNVANLLPSHAGFTTIGASAFSGWTSASGSLSIPSNITTIGNSAFNGCTGLTGALSIPNTVNSLGTNAFQNCSNLTSLTIANSVTSLGANCFDGCTGFTSVVIGRGVTSIPSQLLKDCVALEDLTIPYVGRSHKTANGTWQYPLGDLFSTTSGAGLTSVSQTYRGPTTSSTTSSTYYIPTSLRNVTITGVKDGNGNATTYMPYGAFYNIPSSSMSISVTLGSGVKQIGERAFYNCSGLTSVTIPNSVTSIGNYAFRDCSGLTSITIGSSVTSIGSYAFGGCSGLTSITIPSSVTSIGSNAFYGYSALTGIKGGSSAETGYIVCQTNTHLTSITNLIPTHAGFTTISTSAFSGWTGLTGGITFPSNITTIGNSAFKGCTGLNGTIDLASVSSVDEMAFYGCTNITSVYVRNCAYFGKNSFGGISTANLYMSAQYHTYAVTVDGKRTETNMYFWRVNGVRYKFWGEQKNYYNPDKNTKGSIFSVDVEINSGYDSNKVGEYFFGTKGSISNENYAWYLITS